MNGLIILFCLAILAFNVYLLYLQIRMSNDIHAMRNLFTTLFKEDVKNILVLQNTFEKTRKQMKVNALSINALSDNLNFPMFAKLTLKKT